MEQKKKFFMECHLAGRKYHDADEVWEKLKVGTELHLLRDSENRYDANAVAVVFHDEDVDDVFCLGYIPRSQNETIAILLEMGWSDIFECRICRIDPTAHAEQQINLTIRVKRKPTLA